MMSTITPPPVRPQLVEARFGRIAATCAAAVTVALFSACAIEDTGTSIDVSYRTTGHPSSLYADGSMCVYSVDLVPCDGSIAHTAGTAPGRSALLLRTVGELVVPTANAHSEDAANRFNTPVVLRIKQDEHTIIDAMQPAPGRYCSVRILFAPADPDAEGLVTNPAMLGRTLSASVATLSDPVVMDVISREELEVEVPLVEPLLLAEKEVVRVDIEFNLSRTMVAVHRMDKHGPGAVEEAVLTDVPPTVNVTFSR